MNKKTRGTTSWEDCEKGILPSGMNVKLPWATSTITSVPLEVCEDVRQSDGWRILYNNIQFIGYDCPVDEQEGMNYLILYNKFTGVLKGFYYSPTIADNNNANWVLTIEKAKTKLFNFVPYFARSQAESATNQITLSNLSLDGVTKGFNKGWNCFMVELAYDENSMSERLNITTRARNQTTYTFNGAFKSASNGTIISSACGENNFFSSLGKGVVSSMGNAAKEWLKNNISTKKGDGKPFKESFGNNTLDNFLQEPLPNLITYGFNKALGSILGQTATSTQTLQFTTNGSVTLSGESETPKSGYIPPIRIPLNGTGERLGVWNLAEKPKYLIKTCPELMVITSMPGVGTVLRYKVNGTPSIVPVKNPDVNCNMITTYSLVEYMRYDGNFPNFFTRPADSHPDVAFCNDVNGMKQEELYNDNNTIIRSMPQSYVILTQGNYPNRTSQKNIPAYDFTLNNYEIRHDIAFKVVTTIYANSVSRVYSAKTFIPENKIELSGTDRPYNWTHAELKSKGYVH